MKIVSYNLNGIRASVRKGLLDWIKSGDVDIFCFQETRATLEEIYDSLNINTNFNLFNLAENDGLKDYYMYFSVAEKKGYSGTGILTKIKPICERKDLFKSLKINNEGRVIVLEFETFFLINVYIPNGTRLDLKIEFLNDFLLDFKEFQKTNKKGVIICSDFNIAHTPLDLSNPKECARRTGFLPIEREIFDNYLKSGLIDSYRVKNPTSQIFTWSSYNSKKLDNTFGWRYRFDYIFINDKLVNKLIDCDVLFDKDYSDHYPVLLEINN
jgi:exodeoxyribonuclease-3